MRYNIQDTITAAKKIEHNSNAPSAHDFMLVPAQQANSLSRLFSEPVHRQLRECPRHIFDSVDLRRTTIPAEWVPAWLQHAISAKRWEQFESCCEAWKRNRHNPKLKDFQITHGGVAGLLLFLMSLPADSIVRQHLFSWAINEPIGAYLLGEALHLPEERPAILEAASSDRRLFYWLSQLRPFAEKCLERAVNKSDLWAGLTLVHHEVALDTVGRWLSSVLAEAPQNAEAASAALILQPTASEQQKTAWLVTLKNNSSIRQAFQTLWWSRITWSSGFDGLCSELLPYATADRSKFWFNWAAMDPVWACANFAQKPVDPLWGVEFLEEMRLASNPCDEAPLRHAMVSRLHFDNRDNVPVLVLDVLNRRRFE